MKPTRILSRRTLRWNGHPAGTGVGKLPLSSAWVPFNFIRWASHHVDPVTRPTHDTEGSLRSGLLSRLAQNVSSLMRLGTFTLVAALSILMASLLAGAQQPAKVPYLGYMSPGDIPRYDNAFLQGLQE